MKISEIVEKQYELSINPGTITLNDLAYKIVKAEKLIRFEKNERCCYWIVLRQLGFWNYERRGSRIALYKLIYYLILDNLGVELNETYASFNALFYKFLFEPTDSVLFVNQPNPELWNDRILTQYCTKSFPTIKKICMVLLSIFSPETNNLIDATIESLHRSDKVLCFEELKNILPVRFTIQSIGISNKIRYYNTINGDKFFLCSSKVYHPHYYWYCTATDYFAKNGYTHVCFVLGKSGIIILPLPILIEYNKYSGVQKTNKKGNKYFVRIFYRNKKYILRPTLEGKDVDVTDYFIPYKTI
jgi:hypothetical protein